jgi:hypothetical protein
MFFTVIVIMMNPLEVKVKVKLTLEQTTKSQGGNKDILLPFL